MKQRNRDEFSFIERQFKKTIVGAVILMITALIMCVIILKQ